MRVLAIAMLLALVALPAAAQDRGRNIWGRWHAFQQHHPKPPAAPHADPHGAPAPLIGAGAPLLIAGAGMVAARLLRRKR